MQKIAGDRKRGPSFEVRCSAGCRGTRIARRAVCGATARLADLRAYFNVDQEDPRLYHIVLNTQRLSIEACVQAVRELAEDR
jgi:cytidylate kinase